MGRVIKLFLVLVAAGIILFGILQLIPYGRNHLNPPVIKAITWDSPTTEGFARRACYDCHSNETTWPWYSNIAPVSWLIQRDVEVGRRRLNFSDWNNPNTREIVGIIQEGEMPPLTYVLMHPAAHLSNTEVTQFIAGVNKTLSK
jgi:hypothetical protein